MSAPFSYSYNLNRLGNAGDTVRIESNDTQRAAVAALADVLALPRFAVTVRLGKSGPTRFRLDYRLEAEVVQACVVTLEPVTGKVARDFTRELHFMGTSVRPRGEAAELDLSDADEDEPEEIDSLHYDLVAPALEEFLLGLDPYPRAPGVEFTPAPDAAEARESPFAALKSLKSRT